MSHTDKVSISRAAVELGITPEELVGEMVCSGEITSLEGDILLQVQPELMLRSGERGVLYNLPGLLWAEVAGGVLEIAVSSAAEGVEEIQELSELVQELELALVDTSVSFNPEFYGGTVLVSRYLLGTHS